MKLENVQILDGLFKESQEKGKDYLLYLDVDRLMAPCYEAAGQTAKKHRYGGWEKTGISGHSIGHWLSAAATMYSITNDQQLKEKLDYAVKELAHIQSFDGEGYVSGFSRTCFDKVFTGDFEVENFSLGGGWVPWYSIHKIYAGLIDTYQLIGNMQALDVVIKLANWAKKGTDQLTDEQFQRMLICEHGGMNEAMADLYFITGNRDYLELATRFCHKAVLDPLAKGIDELQGKHANTQIPKVIGAAKLYMITGDETYKHMAEYFWKQVTKHRSYVIGGNSINEHFGPENTEELGIQTTETCNTYNMLKLTELLFQWSQKAEYTDYYEKALYNHILASQDPDSGMKTYFVSTQPGHFKVYCTPDESFWCCTGTGMENPARYNRHIYYENQEDLFINLFISSDIHLKNKNLKLKQVTNFPESNKTKLLFNSGTKENVRLHIRVPGWVSGPMTVLVNGQKQYQSQERGYITIESQWSEGDIIDIEIPMSLHVSRSKNDPRKAAILFGPIVLAGALGREKFPETDIIADHVKLNNHPLINVPDLITNEEDVSKWITPIEGEKLAFRTAAIGQPGNRSVTLIPFYDLHHQRYTIYWNVMDETAYQSFVDKEQEEAKKLREITVDSVQPHEQQPEVDHAIKSKNSRSGYLNLFNSGWRDCKNEGYFSYEMTVNPENQMYLLVSYSGNDTVLHEDGKAYQREFDIFIDGSKIAHQKLKRNDPGKLFDVCYDIPLSLTQGKERVEVKFASEDGKVAGGVYRVRILNDKSVI
ncbi:glycoside hydrolase family 127 protein [Bacillus sp. SA1-12]|uniref:glycoside hydrolase family 127 protein n=1 Tax=Bacillus sp. SA1-12 TaxID=1455638 RepID=UPI001E357E88|nr:glycoside hydrolase family 127 protein [Bacillus sp. SA1-12]